MAIPSPKISLIPNFMESMKSEGMRFVRQITDHFWKILCVWYPGEGTQWVMRLVKHSLETENMILKVKMWRKRRLRRGKENPRGNWIFKFNRCTRVSKDGLRR